MKFMMPGKSMTIALWQMADKTIYETERKFSLTPQFAAVVTIKIAHSNNVAIR